MSITFWYDVWYNWPVAWAESGRFLFTGGPTCISQLYHSKQNLLIWWYYFSHNISFFIRLLETYIWSVAAETRLFSSWKPGKRKLYSLFNYNGKKKQRNVHWMLDQENTSSMCLLRWENESMVISEFQQHYEDSITSIHSFQPTTTQERISESSSSLRGCACRCTLVY